MASIFQGFFPAIREKRTRVRRKPCAEGIASMVVHLGALEPVGNLEAGGQALGVRAFLRPWRNTLGMVRGEARKATGLEQPWGVGEGWLIAPDVGIGDTVVVLFT